MNSPPISYERIFAREVPMLQNRLPNRFAACYNGRENDLFFMRIQPRDEGPDVRLPSLGHGPEGMDGSGLRDLRQVLQPVDDGGAALGEFFCIEARSPHSKLAPKTLLFRSQMPPGFGLHSEYPEE